MEIQEIFTSANPTKLSTHVMTDDNVTHHG